jgi:hypothetical protein
MTDLFTNEHSSQPSEHVDHRYQDVLDVAHVSANTGAERPGRQRSR